MNQMYKQTLTVAHHKDNPVLGKTEITEGRSDTPPKAVSQIIPRESTSATSQLWEYSRGAILG